jgi:hypothetical protein
VFAFEPSLEEYLLCINEYIFGKFRYSQYNMHMHIRRSTLLISVSVLALAPLIAFSWTGPTAPPPTNNVAAPVNVGGVAQYKAGNLGLDGLAVFGNSLLSGTTGSNAYLNFGTTTSITGYGIRDNAGLLEFKNSGGPWASLQSTIFTLCGGGACGGGGSWATSGNNIYNNNTGNVGIGVNPNTSGEALQVKSPSTNFAIFSDWTNTTLRISGDGSGNVSLNTDTQSQGIRLVPALRGWGLNAGLMVSGVGKVYIGTIYDAVYNAQLTIVEEHGNDSPLNLKVAGTYPHSQIIFQNDWGLIGNIYTSGAATMYNTSSDRRLKENIATTTTGLSTLLRIPVEDFNFINDKSKTRTQGFIAQDLYAIYPKAVTVGGDDAGTHPWQVDYGRVTPLIVEAVQQIASISDAFKTNLVAWLADAANGITDIFAGTFHAKDQLCINDTCVTESQLKALLADAAGAAGSTSLSNAGNSATTTPDTTTPITPSGTNRTGRP